MKTIKDLIAELQKFPEDAVCYAYEGEDYGLVIKRGDQYGFIHCSPMDSKDNLPTETFS